MKSLLDAFFGESVVDKKITSETARKFFAEHSGTRQAKAREALKNFEKLPDNVQAVVFERAGVERKRLFELSPSDRVKLWRAAEKIAKDIRKKLDLANVALSSLHLLVRFKGDDGL